MVVWRVFSHESGWSPWTVVPLMGGEEGTGDRVQGFLNRGEHGGKVGGAYTLGEKAQWPRVHSGLAGPHPSDMML